MRSLLAVSTVLFWLAPDSVALAGAELKIAEDASINLGLGLRTSYTSTENGAANGTSDSNNFAVENARLYTSGQFGKIFKATMNFNTASRSAGGDNDLKIIDAIAQFEFNDAFNIWVGRMLPPTDRANLYGPFYTSAWSFPGVAQNYPTIIAGRDDGAMVWGSAMAGKLAYSFGAFNGHNRGANLSNDGHKLLYAGRLQVSFWDPETGYYRNGTYLGAKDIFSIGLAANSLSDGVGTSVAKGDLKIWSVDLLLEKKLAGGFVPTFEAQYWKYDTGGVTDCGACTGENQGGQAEGKSYLVSALLLFPTKVGWGQFQPFVRHQKYDRDLIRTTSKATDIGLNYIINGFNAKVSAVYTKFETTALADIKQFVLGVQLQY